MDIADHKPIDPEAFLINLARLRAELRLIEGKRGKVHVDADLLLCDALAAAGLWVRDRKSGAPGHLSGLDHRGATRGGKVSR